MTPRWPNGETRPSVMTVTPQGERTLGTETSQYREEREINRDVLSSGERNGQSPNRTPLGVWGCRTCTRLIKRITEVFWKVAP